MGIRCPRESANPIVECAPRLFPAARFRVSGPNFIAEGARLASAGPLIGATGRWRRQLCSAGTASGPHCVRGALRVIKLVCCTHQRQGRDDEIAQPRRESGGAAARSAPPRSVDDTRTHSARRLRRQRTHAEIRRFNTIGHGDCGRASKNCSRGEHAALLLLLL